MSPGQGWLALSSLVPTTWPSRRFFEAQISPDQAKHQPLLGLFYVTHFTQFSSVEMKHSSLCQFPRVQKSKLGRGGADVLGAGLRAAPACKSRGSAICRSAFSCRAMGNNNTDDDGGLLAGRGSEPLGPGAGLGGAGVAALVGGVLLIGLVLAGNSLVCVSVASERTLQTPTNYFIVSLAAADLLLAILVLPLFVYSEVSLHVPAPLSSVPSARPRPPPLPLPDPGAVRLHGPSATLSQGV